MRIVRTAVPKAICIIVAVAALLLVSSGSSPAQAPAPVTTIRVSSSPTDDLRPLLYAQSAGLFKKVGLDVQLSRATSGAVVAQSVISGAMDVGKSSLVSLIDAYARGIPFVMVAPATIHQKDDANDGVMVLANSPFKSALDLQGKVVGCTAIGDIGYLGLRAMIDQQGGDSSTVRFIELPTTVLGATLEQGRVDAGITNEPYMSKDLGTEKFRMLTDMLNGYGPRPILESAFFSTRDYVAKNRDAMARFAKVMAQASAYANTHIPETLPLMIAFSGMDAHAAAIMHKTYTAPAFDPSQIQPVIDVAAKYKIIPKSFSARDMLSVGI
jgi:ABC-type nitrate/sulfonate/bicarbonate transport system substrate-binding protein